MGIIEPAFTGLLWSALEIVVEKHLAHAQHINSLVYIWEEGTIPWTCAEHGAPGTCPGQEHWAYLAVGQRLRLRFSLGLNKQVQNCAFSLQEALTKRLCLVPLSPPPLSQQNRPKTGSIDKTITWSTCDFCQEPFSLVIMEVNTVQEVLQLFEFQIWLRFCFEN